MSEYMTIIGRYYDFGEVITVGVDIDIPKLDGSTYRGDRVTYRDDKGEVRDAKFASAYINITPFQADLKGDIGSLKAGDKITLYKEHCYKTAEGAGLNPQEIKDKKIARYSVRRIRVGHEVPPEVAESKTTPQQSAAIKQSYSRDTTGMEVGHALNSARQLLPVAKAKSVKTFNTAAMAIHDLTVQLKGETKEANPKMSAYDVGAMVGHAVKDACTAVSVFKDVEAVARTTIADKVPVIEAHVRATAKAAKEEAKAAKDAAKEAAAIEAQAKADAKKEPAGAAGGSPSTNTDGGDDGFEDDDIPF